MPVTPLLPPLLATLFLTDICVYSTDPTRTSPCRGASLERLPREKHVALG